MAGYKALGMSYNALAAYQQGERPWNRWTKDIMENYCKQAGMSWAKYKDVAIEKLREMFLVPTARHHVGGAYKYTMFYKWEVTK